MFRVITIVCCLVLLSQGQVDYNDQGSWGGDCQTGMRQSPIDIITNDAATGSNHRFGTRFFDGSVKLDPKGIDLKNSFPASEMSIIDGDQ